MNRGERLKAFSLLFHMVSLVHMNESYWVCAYRSIEVKGKLAAVDHHRSTLQKENGRYVSFDFLQNYDDSARRRRWRKVEIKGLPEETSIYGIYSYVMALDRSI
ncbi:hypothetical protein H5410_001162 [Solanum commersonii]|uniref:Uncharacterized protein n=1 Tax=Solanum commersonii TaxID=4109 RepID=A0A9J6AXW4_SOLCO|nr:hypothetical protein H5410_001162 [Solanum commersonii]